MRHPTPASQVVTVENYAPSITGAAMSVSTSEDVAVTLPDVVVTDDAPETDTLQLDVSVDYGLVALGSTTGLTSAVTPGSVAAYSVTGTIVCVPFLFVAACDTQPAILAAHRAMDAPLAGPCLSFVVLTDSH